MHPCFAAALCAAIGISAASAQSPTLRIRVLDYASVPAATLHAFAAPARAVFLESGIESDWPTCRVAARQGTCEPLADDELYVKIVPKAAPGSVIRFGTTIRQGSRGIFAYVFWAHVQQAAVRHGVAPSLLLAHVIAHETGHLLGLEHTARGIMQSDFGAPQILSAGRGLLRFTDDESTMLRGALSPRLTLGNLYPTGEPRRGPQR